MTPLLEAMEGLLDPWQVLLLSSEPSSANKIGHRTLQLRSRAPPSLWPSPSRRRLSMGMRRGAAVWEIAKRGTVAKALAPDLVDWPGGDGIRQEKLRSLIAKLA